MTLLGDAIHTNATNRRCWREHRAPGFRDAGQRAASVAKGDKSLIEAVAAYERVMLPRGFDTVDSSLRLAGQLLALTTEGCLWWRLGYLAKPGTASGSGQPLDSLVMRGGSSQVPPDHQAARDARPSGAVGASPWHRGVPISAATPACSPAAVFRKAAMSSSQPVASRSAAVAAPVGRSR
jgi:hypothetical protein